MGRPWGRRALTRAQEQERGAQTRGHQRAPPPPAPPHACPARAAVRGVRPGPHPKPASRPAPPLDPPTDDSSDQEPKPAPEQLAPGPPADPLTDESSDRTLTGNRTRNPTPNPPQGRPGTGPRSWIRTRDRFGTLPAARTTALGAGARALLARGGVGGRGGDCWGPGRWARRIGGPVCLAPTQFSGAAEQWSRARRVETGWREPCRWRGSVLFRSSRGAILYPRPRSLVTLADERAGGARCPVAFLLRYVPGVQGLAWGTSRQYVTPPEPPFPESGPRVSLSSQAHPVALFLHGGLCVLVCALELTLSSVSVWERLHF